jgi:hypothetical protein
MRFECLIYVTSLSGAEKAVAVEISGDIFAIHLSLRKDIQQCAIFQSPLTSFTRKHWVVGRGQWNFFQKFVLKDHENT